MEPKVILYIVVAIGYGIYKIYKRVKTPQVEKKTYQPQSESKLDYVEEPSQESQSGYKTIDDIINDLNSHGKVKPQQKATPATQKRAQTSKDIAQEIEQEYNEVKSQQKSVSSHLNTSKKLVPSKRVISKKKEVKFDIRKAVLYRAVLERPKF